MDIKILGSGCANCKNLEMRTREALQELKLEADIEKVEDFQRIASYGVMRTPALVIGEKVMIAGHVPPVQKIKELLQAGHTSQ